MNRPYIKAAVADHGDLAHHELWISRTLWLAGATIVFVAASVLGVGFLAAVAIVAFGAVAVKTYIDNESHLDVRASIDDAWDAVIDSLGENGFAFGEPTWHGATEGRLLAGDARVVVEKHPGGTTRVRVRIGLFDRADNRRRAGLLIESVRRRVR